MSAPAHSEHDGAEAYARPHVSLFRRIGNFLRDAWQRSREATIHASRWVSAMLFVRDMQASTDPSLSFMNPRVLISQGKLAILVFVLGFFGWAALAPLDSAIIARGVVVVESHRKSIQHLEGGIVREVLVSDGQMVKRGQQLLRLDDTQARASLNLLVSEADALEAQEARLTAERDGGETIVFPKDLMDRVSDPDVVSAMRGEENVFDTRRETLQKQIDILKQRNLENARIAAGLKSQSVSVEQQKKLIDQEIDSVQSLYDKGLSTLPRLLALQRQAADLNGQTGDLSEKIAQVELNSGENELQISTLRSQQLSDVVKDLRDIQAKRFDLQNRIAAARDVFTRLVLRAPVSGRIVGLSVHTPGEIVQPAVTLMEIVPDKDVLEVEARVRPEDADDVRIGMTARVNLSAYQQRRLPVIVGNVNYVSADQLTDRRTGQTYFSVDVTVDRGQLKDYPNARLIPGLPVEVSIDTGTRTALDYFVEPISDVLRRGMREK